MLEHIKQIPLHFAHEVYVLNDQTIDADQHNHSVNIWHALHDARSWLLFIFFAALIGGLFALALYLRTKPSFQKLGKQIDKTTVFAPDIIRIAFGASLLFSVSHAALYGPELPLHDIAGGNIIRALLWISGTGLILGLWSRVWAVLMMIVWAWALILKGPYLITYINYLGEAIAVFLLPLQKMSIDGVMTGKKKSKQLMKYATYSMPIARVLFGLSLVYTAVSVKFLDTSLTLDVVKQYDLTRFFPFEPLFVVFGAAMIEVTVALLIMAGVALRFTSFVFLIVMTLSLIFFKESVWPHYLLIALGIGVLLHKPDDWTFDRYFFTGKKKLVKK